MRQLVTGALLTAVFFLLTPNSFLNGQDVTGPGPNALFAPETPTMWHKTWYSTRCWANQEVPRESH